ELGLLSAIQELTCQYKIGPTQFTVNGPKLLPPLPAAVEVAAFRIVQEAITNVVKHSRAEKCLIDITLDEKLHIMIKDDGKGLPDQLPFGIGMDSMKERAEELGGNFF